MNYINPNAILLIVLATVIGAVAGSWLIGLLVGLVFVAFCTVVSA